MVKSCKVCTWGGRQKDIETIICCCPLSGYYTTDVLETESCDKWKKASDEWLKAIDTIQ